MRSGTAKRSAEVDVLPTLLPGFSGTALPDWVRRRLQEGLGGVCLFARNIASHEQLAALNAEILEANPRAVIALDEEGGDVTRLFADVGSPYPGNAVLGRLDDLDLSGAVAPTIVALVLWIVVPLAVGSVRWLRREVP